LLITGIDIVEIERVGRVTAEYGKRFLERIYTEQEILYCRGRAPQLASRFAAKEAVMKLLGTGTRGVGWKDIEIRRRRGSAHFIELSGRAKIRAAQIGLHDIALSLSHSEQYAVASVIGESERGNLIPRVSKNKSIKPF